MASSLRYRAATHISYALALIALVRYARVHPEPDFQFGPLNLEALDKQGLVISGVELSDVSDLMEGIEGLTEVPA